MAIQPKVASNSRRSHGLMGVIWLLYLVKEMQMRNIACNKNLSCRPKRGVSTSPLALGIAPP